MALDLSDPAWLFLLAPLHRSRDTCTRLTRRLRIRHNASALVHSGAAFSQLEIAPVRTSCWLASFGLTWHSAAAVVRLSHGDLAVESDGRAADHNFPISPPRVNAFANAAPGSRSPEGSGGLQGGILV